MSAWSKANSVSLMRKMSKTPWSMKYSTIRSPLLAWVRAYPARPMRSRVSSRDSCRATASATAVALLGWYAGLLRIFENSFRSMFARLYTSGSVTPRSSIMRKRASEKVSSTWLTTSSS